MQDYFLNLGERMAMWTLVFADLVDHLLGVFLIHVVEVLDLLYKNYS